MEQSYLLQLIKTLKPDELQATAEYISSPFVQRGKQEEEAYHLYRIILETSPGFSEQFLRKEKIYNQLFPGEKTIAGKLEKVMVCLSGLIRSFLLYQHYFRDDNEFYRDLEWTKLLRKRGLELKSRQMIDKLEKHQQSDHLKDSEHFFRQYLLEYEIHDRESYSNRKKGNLNIPKVLHNLDIYYHFNRIEMLNHLMLQHKVAKVEAHENTSFALNEINLPEKYLKESILLLISDRIHRLLSAQQPNVGEFHALADLLLQHEQEIEPNMVQRFYTYLRSLSAFMINSGFKELLPVLFRILQHNLEKGFLYYEGKIASGTFANVTNVALRVKEYDWAFHFIESHKDRIIGESETRDYYRLNLANYHFAIGNFDQALDLLPATLQDWDYQFIARRLRLKIYYELDSDLLPYEIDAFKMFVSRSTKKVPSTYFRQLQSNFVNLLHQIVHSPPGDKDRARRLIQRIESKKVVAEKDWLLEKASRLA